MRARSWGVCARSRDVRTHKGVFAKSTTRVYPSLGLEQDLGGTVAGELKAGSSFPAPLWDEGARGHGGHSSRGVGFERSERFRTP